MDGAQTPRTPNTTVYVTLKVHISTWACKAKARTSSGIAVPGARHGMYLVQSPFGEVAAVFQVRLETGSVGSVGVAQPTEASEGYGSLPPPEQLQPDMQPTE